MTMPAIGISPGRLSGLDNQASFCIMGYLIGVIIYLQFFCDSKRISCGNSTLSRQIGLNLEASRTGRIQFAPLFKGMLVNMKCNSAENLYSVNVFTQNLMVGLS